MAVDTHALYWHLTEDPRLSESARMRLTAAETGRIRVFVPGIVLVELVYLEERRRVDAAALDRALAIFVAGGAYALAPLDAGTIRALRRRPRPAVPDMPDRILVATALQLGVPLITRDAAIRRSGVVETVW